MKLLRQFFYRGWVVNIYDNEMFNVEEQYHFKFEYTVKRGRRKYWDPTSHLRIESAILYAKEEVDARIIHKKKARWKGRKRKYD